MAASIRQTLRVNAREVNSTAMRTRYGESYLQVLNRVVCGRWPRVAVAPRESAQKNQLLVKTAATEANVQMILEALLFSRLECRILLPAHEPRRFLA